MARVVAGGSGWYWFVLVLRCGGVSSSTRQGWCWCGAGVVLICTGVVLVRYWFGIGGRAGVPVVLPQCVAGVVLVLYQRDSGACAALAWY